MPHNGNLTVSDPHIGNLTVNPSVAVSKLFLPVTWISLTLVSQLDAGTQVFFRLIDIWEGFEAAISIILWFT